MHRSIPERDELVIQLEHRHRRAGHLERRDVAANQVPRRLKELHLRLGAATGDLSQRLGRAPTATELAAELDMDRDEVIEGLVAGSSYNTLSIDSGGSGSEDAPAIADTLGDVDTGLDQIDNRESLRPLLAALPERERTVLIQD